MPYSSTSELPESVREKYGQEAQQAYMDAFNGCVQRHGEEKSDEANCYAIAHTAAKNASNSE